MKRAERQPETISVTIYGGIWYKLWTVPDADSIIPQHAHCYDHLTALLQGVIRVWRDGVSFGEFRAPATILIPAFQKHEFRTLTPNCVLACIHNADHADPADGSGEPPIAAEHHLVFEED